MTDRDEKEPIETAGDLPVPEVGDLGSFAREPEHGDPDAPEPELESMGEPIMGEPIPDADLHSATATDEERNQ